ncbi:VOC family protein [Bacillus sp. B15-48]|uniref:VOC family protein n=1 Tax=Bacillus sp. B15-48 TaxID=1548601 RepID=UPI00193F168C|nr:VOC family protein [Bacillus sp. B15-48]MBM4763331.1 glyoxalase [Bacillus sp. B15-48]
MKEVFTKVLQVGIVVDNLEAYMKRYEEDFGIGPWEVLYFNKDNVREMTVYQEKKDFSIKVGFCDYYNVQLELIEPLDLNDTNIYTEFLREHGPGLHHIALDTNDHDETVNEMEKRDVKVIQSGIGRKKFTYFDLRKELGFIGEIYGK